MGCNCGKNRTANQARRSTSTTSGATQSFALVTNGSKVEYGSKLEADAANARQGYTGIVKPVSA